MSMEGGNTQRAAAVCRGEALLPRGVRFGWAAVQVSGIVEPLLVLTLGRLRLQRVSDCCDSAAVL